MLQHIEIGEVREMTKQHHRHIDLPLHRFPLFQRKLHRIFFLNVNIVVIRYHTQHWNAADFFHHLHTRLKQAKVATKLIDNDSLDALAVFRRLQGHRTVGTGKHTSPVDVGYQNHIRMGMTRHGQIYQIRILQVDFRDAARSFHHHRIVTGCQAVECLVHFPAQLIPSLCPEIGIRTPVAYGLAVQYHL